MESGPMSDEVSYKYTDRGSVDLDLHWVTNGQRRLNKSVQLKDLFGHITMANQQQSVFILFILLVSSFNIVIGKGFSEILFVEPKDNIISQNTTGTDEGPTETQTAQCTITSGDVKASAQASVTTRLDGVCETSE